MMVIISAWTGDEDNVNDDGGMIYINVLQIRWTEASTAAIDPPLTSRRVVDIHSIVSEVPRWIRALNSSGTERDFNCSQVLRWKFF